MKKLLIALLVFATFGFAAQSNIEGDVILASPYKVNTMAAVAAGIEGFDVGTKLSAEVIRDLWVGSDFDGDGNKEVMYASYGDGSGRAYVYEIDGDNNATLFFDTGAMGGTYTSSTRHVAYGDLDGNGMQELLVSVNSTNDATGGIWAFEYDTVGDSMRAPVQLFKDIVTADRWYCENFTVGDVDQDGVEEIFFGNNGTSSATDNFHIESVESGTFAENNIVMKNEFIHGKTSATFPIGGSPYGGVISDLNGDGMNEVLFAPWDHGAMLIVENDSVDSYTAVNYIQTDLDRLDDFAFWDFLPYDVDGDGRDEAYLSMYSAGRLYVTTCPVGTELADMTTANVHTIDDQGSSGGVSTQIGDLDGNGKMNIYASGGGSYLTNHEFVGTDPTDSTHWVKQDNITGASFAGVYGMRYAGDLDGDGLDEIYGANTGSSTVMGSALEQPPVPCDDLFFSQYIEGGSYNKALEIYNGTGAPVDLADYIILGNHNGSDWSEAFTFPAGTMIANEDVYVIVNDKANATILAEADTVIEDPYASGTSYIVSFNGDDVRALCEVNGTDTTMIDIIGGNDLSDPGSGWDVAGTTSATKDHTIIRKSFVTSGYTNWKVIAGTEADNSEWTVLAKDDYTGIGSHTVTDDAPTSLDVTFKVNTSTIRVITDSLSTVDLRGTATQWGPGTDLTCVGGDYWELTIPLDASTDYQYKYGARTTNLDETVSDWWENDIPGANYQGDNRLFSTRYFDQVVGLDYLGHGPDNNTPNYTPTDSIDVFFRVNVDNDLDFDPENILSIVGAIPANGADHIWSPGNYPLTQEGTSGYWNIHLKLDPAAAPFDSMMYRFHNNGYDWNGHSENVTGHGMFPDNENRGVSIGYNDTTIAWKWWNDDAPAPFTSTDSTDITFTANMSKASNNNSYTVGDTILVKVGYGNSSTEVVTDTLTRQGFTFTYATTINKLPVIYGDDLYYQYYLYKNGAEQREVYFNFDYTGSDNSLAERRFIESDTTTAVNDIVDSENDARRMPIFKNNDKIAQSDLTLTLECDIRPAIYQVLAGSTLEDIQSSINITPAMMTTNPDTILELGVFVNGPMSNDGEGTWQGWGGTLAGDTTRQMYDDATHGDKWAGDSIFTCIIKLSSDSGHAVGQEFKFGIGGGDNESGYGLNHIENIDDSESATTLYTQFGSIDPNFYDAWDYDNPNPRVTKVENVVPTEFALEQNYPNPFNPSTTIEFSIPELADVNLTIFNVLGQRIKTIQMTNKQAGKYNVIWNGTNDLGAKVSTGIYFYRIDAGKYSDIKKMVFMK